MHGGKSLVGAASPKLTTGKHSKHLGDFLRGDLKARFETALSDVDLMDTRDELALLYTRLTRLLENGEDASLWDAVNDAWLDFKAAFHAGNVEAAQVRLDELDKLIKRGTEDVGRWGEVYDVQARLLRTRESERRRLVELKQNVPAEEAIMYMQVIAHAVRTHVTDPVAVQKIIETIIQFVGQSRLEKKIN